MAKTAIVTGASQGIGKATALEFARQGYNIVLAARQADRLEAAATEVRSIGLEALTLPTDVKDPVQVNNLVQKALAQFGSIDVLVNNAGIFQLGPLEDCSLSDWHQIIDTNIWGYIHTIEALLPHFLERGTGTIVNISSIGGLVAIPYHTPYTTSKFAVAGMTKAMHAELAPKGIHVCGIYPNFIQTNIIERALFRGHNEETANARYEMVNKVLQSSVLEKPEDVAQAIWQAVKHKRSDVVVGTANLLKATYQLFPSLMQSMFRRLFGLNERC